MIKPHTSYIAVVYTITIFLSASLLFFVQPLFAKMVLPHLGGAPAVWTTAMLFFQSALLAGYGYAHFAATRLSVRVQIGLHAAVWTTGLIFLPIAIPAAWIFDPDAFPAFQALTIFAFGVGVPFFALAANAPLLQKWYARSGGPSAEDPYHLYASSNAGSLIALLAFPLVAEPLMRTSDITRLWAGLYLLLGLGLALCALYAVRGQAATAVPRAAVAIYRPSVVQVMKWVGLAFVPSSMMLGVTSIISTDLGAFPLIWVVPLALYLLTFVLAFSARLRPPEAVVVFGFIISVIAVIVPLAMNMLPKLGLIGFGVLYAAFFSAALLFHMRLYDTRPPEAGLTPFYFAMASGGALGGLFNSIVAPLAFDSMIETPIVFAIAGLALGGLWRPLRDAVSAAVALAMVSSVVLMSLATGLLGPKSTGFLLTVGALVFVALLIARRKPLRFTLTSAGLLLLGHMAFWNQGITHRERSFFGVYIVRDATSTGLRQLTHGTTQHGLQFLDDLGKRPRILSYYHPNSPLGQIFRSGAVGPQARVGIVGLGVGALSCYGETGQDWRFYEIDRLVDDIARNPAFFSYMENCAGDAPTILGDARLTLARETDTLFDILVIDAFSSDAIPIHLITIEALALYRSRLTPGGLLALHISNRYFELSPILANAARELGLRALDQKRLGTAANPLAPGETGSNVVLMSPDPKALDLFANDPNWHELKANGRRVWTDDHANLFWAL
ncbi:MAG: fused MFS/spermidine synthase [Alphaproteobacteria bacterium]